jgi:hypothetical protein
MFLNFYQEVSVADRSIIRGKRIDSSPADDIGR